MSEPLSNMLGLKSRNYNQKQYKTTQEIDAYNQCLEDLDQLSPDVHKLAEIISKHFGIVRITPKKDDDFITANVAEDVVNYHMTHGLAQEIINSIGVWIKKG